MADNALLLALLLLISVCITDVEGGYSCHYRATRYYPYETYTFYRYCQYGCCSSDCCTSSTLSVSVGVIVGCVVGGIALLSLLVSVVCCCIRRRGQPGRVMQPVVNNGTPSVSVVQHGVSGATATGPPHYNYGMQPMGGASTPYKPYDQAPPPYPGPSPSPHPPSHPPAPDTTEASGYVNPAFPSSPPPDSSQPEAGLANPGYSQPPAPGFRD